MTQKFSFLFYLIVVSNICLCQSHLNYFKITSPYASFPDTGRMNGHVYNNVSYNTADHYSDSSVLIIAPVNFHPKKKINIIFWFHGWYNNIDSAVVRYGLSRQFEESGVDAVLVLAEAAKDAPDSYGGKLERRNVFKRLVNDVTQKLVQEKVIPAASRTGNIILAGHSGAYRVIAGILQNGNVQVNEVILLDALYADTDKYLKWLTSDRDHRFINLYTNDGGTYEETKSMMRQIEDVNIPAESLEEMDVTPEILQKNRIVFIHSLHAHNDIIQHPDNFRLVITNSPF